MFQSLAEGKSSKEVASFLNLSTKTAETHRSNIMRKLDFHSIRDLVIYAVRTILSRFRFRPLERRPPECGPNLKDCAPIA